MFQWHLNNTFKCIVQQLDLSPFSLLGLLEIKGGKWGASISATWIGLNIVIPLALLRIPAVQKVLVAVGDKLPFDIPGIG